MCVCVCVLPAHETEQVTEHTVPQTVNPLSTIISILSYDGNTKGGGQVLCLNCFRY